MRTVLNTLYRRQADMITIADKILSGAESILYPEICPVCGRALPTGIKGRRGHPSCVALLKKVREPYCMKCGKPLDDEDEYCYDCRHQNRAFVQGRGLWVYDSVSSESIFLFKYGKKRELAGYFAGALLENFGDWIEEISPDLIIPVPLSREKLRSRGFNQAGMIAELLGSAGNIPVDRHILVRSASTAAQKELGKEQRRENLRNAFDVSPGSNVRGKKILIIDDIYTTGSTMNYCALTLRSAGAAGIWFLTLCIGAKF